MYFTLNIKKCVKPAFVLAALAMALSAFACGSSSEDKGYAAIKNNFGTMPPWTICQAYYQGTDFGKIPIGATSAEMEVDAGLGFVYMVAAWDDPDCKPENCLPIASKVEHETVKDQHHVITIEMANHQGPCPPEGVQPIPEATYNKILSLWPQYNFKPYAERAQNTECLD